jgi:ribonucleotide reductase alpha subunit
MLLMIIKRDGSVENFDSSKLVKWAKWASSELKGRVNWASVVSGTLAGITSERIHSQQLQNELINSCLLRKSWPYYRMAGKLYATMYRKELYGKSIPTVKQLQNKLTDLGLMVRLDYTDADYEIIEGLIDHERDFKMAHFQLEQARAKYSLGDKTGNIRFETPQFIYMRMAMALAEDEDVSQRMVHIKHWYDYFSLHKLNPPGPNYDNLGTPSNGYASCCLFTAGDSAPSLAAHDLIAYTMTYMSAGTGSYINTRSEKDPIRGGKIKHKGKLPYFRSLAGQVKANTQGSRGGACTAFYNAFDPEANTISMLQNPRTSEAKRNKDIHFAMNWNRFIYEKAARDEDIFVFTVYNAPDLLAKFFSDDYIGFAELYAKYDQDPAFNKTYVKARSILFTNGQQSHEVATNYRAQIDEINRNTPFKDPIVSSNLCVAPETKILTKLGYLTIKDLRDQSVEVWNGHEWSEVIVRRTAESAKLVRVTTQEGHELDCTPMHKFKIKYGSRDTREVVAIQLRPMDKLIDMFDPYDTKHKTSLTIKSVTDLGRIDETYCFTEPKRNMGVFNGILAGNCLEILQPTAPYESAKDLYATTYIGDMTFLDQNGRKNVYPCACSLVTKNAIKQAYDLEVGDVVIGTHNSFTGLMNRFHEEIEVESIIHRTVQPEVSLCSIGGIVVSNIENDEEYANVAYYAYKMVDKCIHKSKYELPHIGFTAKNRLNAGIGMLGLAYAMAKKGYAYNSEEGLAYIHEVSETHSYHCVRAALRLGKELGNAPWIHRTKWPDGWLPIDSYRKAVDTITPCVYKRDWETLRAEIIENKGIRFSSLMAHMPTESSSKASGVPNGVYPVRDLTLVKSDGDNIIRWCAPDDDILAGNYQLAWELSFEDMIKVYALIQKFTDQGISADFWINRDINPTITNSSIMEEFFLMIKYGIKTKYYQNTYSIKADEGMANNQTSADTSATNSKHECEGVCSL